ncbi:hypothetical protein [Actinacidiphila oryziradicis]|uniref:Uncharacterized protein n=1 Tax=Actinacidiphila oryziradicis TaxID=2571141 RepID=A0A4U0RK66_9ACTN|nr:hypothetical protein [Actinacidiphila oryziradicis]TJZ95637.1 hypothetical protein FCI23_52015 [Actinacidiphila oryziradicis]
MKKDIGAGWGCVAILAWIFVMTTVAHVAQVLLQHRSWSDFGVGVAVSALFVAIPALVVWLRGLRKS